MYQQLQEYVNTSKRGGKNMHCVTLLFGQIILNIFICLGSDFIQENKGQNDQCNFHDADYCLMKTRCL